MLPDVCVHLYHHFRSSSLIFCHGRPLDTRIKGNQFNYFRSRSKDLDSAFRRCLRKPSAAKINKRNYLGVWRETPCTGEFRWEWLLYTSTGIVRIYEMDSRGIDTLIGNSWLLEFLVDWTSGWLNSRLIEFLVDWMKQWMN